MSERARARARCNRSKSTLCVAAHDVHNSLRASTKKICIKTDNKSFSHLQPSDRTSSTTSQRNIALLFCMGTARCSSGQHASNKSVTNTICHRREKKLQYSFYNHFSSAKLTQFTGMKVIIFFFLIANIKQT